MSTSNTRLVSIGNGLYARTRVRRSLMDEHRERVALRRIEELCTVNYNHAMAAGFGHEAATKLTEQLRSSLKGGL